MSKWVARQHEYAGRTCWCVKAGQRIVADLMTEEDAKRVVLLLEGGTAAYHHLDTYGVVSGTGIEREKASQERIFDLLREAIR